MIRLNLIVEGRTEEAFANGILVSHLAQRDVFVSAKRATFSRRRGRVFKGGVRSYSQARDDLRRWMRQDQKDDARFTTMFDLYRLPRDFPGFEAASGTLDPHNRVKQLERSFREDVADRRFEPYIQLHEFEALLLCDPSKFSVYFPNLGDRLAELRKVAASKKSPEFIDDGDGTAPSKRIIKIIPEYEVAKATAGPQIAAAIGLETMKMKCEHFGAWLGMIEKLARA